MRRFLSVATAMLLVMLVGSLASAQGQPRGRLGVMLEALPADQLAQIERSIGVAAGVRVTAVQPGSSAERGDIRAGDLILAIAKRAVASPQQVIQELADKAGRTEFTLARPAEDGSLRTATVFVELPAPDGGAAPVGPVPVGPVPVGPVPAQPGQRAALERALGALESARISGVLTDDEYDTRWEELIDQLRAVVPEAETAEQVMQALDAAYQAGALTQPEYERKRAAHGAPGPVVAAPPVGPGPVPPVATAAPGMVTYADPQGRFRLAHPVDWRIEATADGATRIVGPSVTVDVVIQPGAGSAAQLLAGIHGQIQQQSQNYRELSRGPRAVGGAPAEAVEFTATNPNGANVLMQLVAQVKGGLGCVFILEAQSTATAAGRAAWEGILASFQLGAAGQ